MVGRARDGGVRFNRFLGNAAQDMDAELQSKRVNVVADRRETLSIGGRGKAVQGGDVTAMRVESEKRIFRVAFRGRICDEPLHINDDVFPSEWFQMLCEPGGVCLYLVFIDRRSIAIPAIPAHRRRGSDNGSRGRRLRRRMQNENGSGSRDQKTSK